MTSSNGNILRVTDPLCGEFTGRRWIPLTKVSDAGLWCFSLICAWTNDRVHNEYAGDLKRHRVHYGVTVMVQDCSISGALAMEILQSCTKPSICVFKIVRVHYQIHQNLLRVSWNTNAMLTKYSSFAALEVVIWTASWENVVNMTFPIRWGTENAVGIKIALIMWKMKRCISKPECRDRDSWSIFFRIGFISLSRSYTDDMFH